MKHPLRRLVLLISELITRIAPPLHSIHWKVFVLFLAVLVLPLALIGYQIRKGVHGSYLHATEEGMIDTAAAVAELHARLVALHGENPPVLGEELGRVYSNLNQTFEIKARLFGFDKEEVDIRILVYDRTGRLLFDTRRESAPGTDFSGQPDVAAALARHYGSRWERGKNGVNLFSTVPVFVQGKVVGAVTVSKPTTRLRTFIFRRLQNLAIPTLVIVAFASGLAFLFSGYLTRTVSALARKAERIAAGEPGVTLEIWSKSELGALARSVERMRQRLEGKAYVEEMARNLSHELKTPLASIRGAAELLEDGACDDPVARVKFLGNIQSEVERLNRLVNNLLKLSRIESRSSGVQPEPLELAPVLRELADVFRSRAETAGVRLELQLGEESSPVRIEREVFELMISNLLDNALQYSPEGGSVTLSLLGGEIAVTDHGPGIEPEILPKIFDRFFTTVNPRTGNRGTGLGLAIVKSIAEAHHGSVAVWSEPGKGARFSVAL